MISAAHLHAVEAWRRRRAEAPARRAARAAEARRAAERVAALLIERFGATRVVLVGSVAHPDWFHRDSDIDLVVEGLGDRYLRALGAAEAEAAAAGFRIDIIPLEGATERARRAAAEGVEVARAG